AWRRAENEHNDEDQVRARRARRARHPAPAGAAVPPVRRQQPTARRPRVLKARRLRPPERLCDESPRKTGEAPASHRTFVIGVGMAKLDKPRTRTATSPTGGDLRAAALRASDQARA